MSIAESGIVERKWYTCAEVRTLVYDNLISVGTIRAMVNRGEIPSERVGSDTDAGGRPVRRRILIPASFVIKKRREALGPDA